MLGSEIPGSGFYGVEPIQELDIDLMLRTLDHIKVYESGVAVKVFLDGREIEYVSNQQSRQCQFRNSGNFN